MGQLANKRAIITGGASGIGRATAFLFARQGSKVAVVDLNEAGSREVVEEITKEGGQAIFISADVSRAADCREAVQAAVRAFGGVDILFNNAGIIRRTDALEASEEEWDLVMAVNAKSVFLMSKYTIPYMMQSGGGSIINTSSGWGLKGGRKALSYCASKAAVVNMTKAMALDYGAQNIRVNCICPGDVDTHMLRDEARQLGQDEVAFLVDSANRPLGRIGSPEEIAQAVLYLASDASSYVTGTALVIDGGGLAG